MSSDESVDESALNSTSAEVDASAIEDDNRDEENYFDEEDIVVDTRIDEELEVAYRKRNLNIVIQKNDFLLPQIFSLIEEEKIINPRPFYQRRLKWVNAQKSALIESILLNVPIPPVFFMEDDLARYEVLDGQQRLMTIKQFLNNEFKLSGLKIWQGLNGRNFSSCPPTIRRGLERRTVSAVILLAEGDTIRHKNLLRRIIFNRLNTGGVALNAQELRNALYPGHFNDMIIRATRSSVFTEAFKIPAHNGDVEREDFVSPSRARNTLYKKMEDCQIVLRFFALRESQNIRGSLSKILDDTMENYQGIDKEEALEMERYFLHLLEWAKLIYGEFVFRLPSKSGVFSRVSKPMFDATMVSLDALYDDLEELAAHSKEIQERYVSVVQKDEKLASMTDDESAFEVFVGRGNTADAIKRRIFLMEELLGEFL